MLAVSNDERIIFVSVAGIVGLIPYQFFRWAHERKINSERNFMPYLTRPSDVFSPGDVIEVAIMEKETNLFQNLYRSKTKDSFKGALGEKAFKILDTERYLLLSLEQEPKVEGALVAISPKTGDLLAMIGGRDFSLSQFNRAIQSRRQPGSAFKPILYAAALENGMTPASIIIDSPEALGGSGEGPNWKPRNYDGKFKGPTTLRNALEQSRNVPTIKIANSLGIEKIKKFFGRLGPGAELEENLTVALGSFGMTLLDLVKTYAIFPSGGKKVEIRSIISMTDRDGSLIPLDLPESSLKIDNGTPEFSDEVDEIDTKKTEINPFKQSLSEKQVYDVRLAYIMTNLLRGVIQDGTGKKAKSLGPYVGGKTGTTSSYIDAWFVGFSANVLTGVWTGFDDNQTLGWPEGGSKAALPIWKDVMQFAIERYGESDFSVPPGIVNVRIRKETGRPANAGEKSFLESFVDGYVPGANDENKADSSDPSSLSPGDNALLLEDDDYYSNQ